MPQNKKPGAAEIAQWANQPKNQPGSYDALVELMQPKGPPDPNKWGRVNPTPTPTPGPEPKPLTTEEIKRMLLKSMITRGRTATGEPGAIDYDLNPNLKKVSAFPAGALPEGDFTGVNMPSVYNKQVQQYLVQQHVRKMMLDEAAERFKSKNKNE
jgi:hypothetical protein